MSESPQEPRAEGFGIYHPEAASYRPYNDAMAAWRNQVKAMQSEGVLPPPAQGIQDEPQQAAEETGDTSGTSESQERPEGAQQAAEGPEEGEHPVDEPHEVFDPAEHNAPEVLEYLKGVGEDEARRVLESEEAGKARKGILNLRDEILAKARENDETDSGSTQA